MFDKLKVENSLYGNVGSRQPYDPSFSITLDADNLLSRSGYYVTDNPHVKLDYLLDSQDYKDIDDTQFNELLANIQKSSIASVCQGVFNHADYIDRQLVYTSALNKAEGADNLPDGFVGYEIYVSSEKNLAFEIKRILLDFEGTGDITLQLYYSNKLDPIYSQVVSITSDHQEIELNWLVNNTDATYKGRYYLGYLTNGLTVAPYKNDFDGGNAQKVISEVCFLPVKVDGHNTNTLFNLEDVDGYTDSTGLNPDVTVFYDYTDLIINNSRLFSYAIYLEMCIRMVSYGLSSLRSNRNQRKNDDLARDMLFELEGNEDPRFIRREGLRNKLVGEKLRIAHEIKKLNEGYFGKGFKVTTLQ